MKEYLDFPEAFVNVTALHADNMYTMSTVILIILGTLPTRISQYAHKTVSGIHSLSSLASFVRSSHKQHIHTFTFHER